MCGKIVKVTDGQKTDDKNPDAAKRSRPIVGLVIMQGAKKTGANKWSGTLYNRADGKSYSGTVTVKSKNDARPVGLRGRRAVQDHDLDPGEVSAAVALQHGRSIGGGACSVAAHDGSRRRPHDRQFYCAAKPASRARMRMRNAPADKRIRISRLRQRRVARPS